MIIFLLILGLTGILLFWPLILKQSINSQKETLSFNIEQKSFFHLQNIQWLFYLENYLFTSILIEIPKIQLTFQNYRLKLKISSIKIYCELKDLDLSRIDGMKGEKVDKGLLMRNCEKIIQEIFDNINLIKDSKKLIKYYERSPFQRGFKGAITFIFMSLCQLLVIDIEKLKLTLVQNHRNSVCDQQLEIFKEKPQHYIDIIKSQKFIGINLNEIVGNFVIDKMEKLSLRLKCSQADLMLKNDTIHKFQKAFQISKISLQLDAPFGYSFTHCFINSQILLQVETIQGEYNCHMVPTYRYIKYFEFLQGRILRYVRNKMLQFTRKELPFIPQKIQILVQNILIQVSKLEDFQDSDGLLGEKVSGLDAKLQNLKLDIIYDLVKDITTQDMNISIQKLEVDSLFQFSDKIHMLDVQQGEIDLIAKYDLNHAGLLYYGTDLRVKNCKCNLHPLLVPLYNAYMNLQLRSYLEYDFDIYSFLLDQYRDKTQIKKQIEKGLLAQIVQQGKKDIREYIITPHEKISLKIEEFLIYGEIQKKPFKKLEVLADQLYWEYETFKNPLAKNTKENLKGSNLCSFSSINFYFLEEKPLSSTNTLQQNQQQQQDQPLYNKVKFGLIQGFDMQVSEEEEQIASNYKLNKFKFDLNEHQIKNLIYYINKIDMELFDETKNKQYDNPYTYKNNPYEKSCYSSKQFNDFSFSFAFQNNENKVLFVCDSLTGESQGPNITKMDTESFYNKIAVEIQYPILEKTQKIQIATIKQISSKFKFSQINETEYGINGLEIFFGHDVNYIGDFFLVLQEQIGDIQVHSEEIAKKVLKKKKKYIEQKFKEQVVDSLVRIYFQNFKLELQDSPGDNFLKGFQAFTREYLSKQKDYSERNCLLNLQKYKQEKHTPLLNIFIQNLQLQLEPLQHMNTFQDIQKFIQKVDQKNKNISLKEEYFKAFRFLELETKLQNLSIQIRDYPYKILELEILRQKGQFILTSLKNSIYQQNYLQRLFYYIEFELGQLDVTVGLSLASGLKEIAQRLLNIFGKSLEMLKMEKTLKQQKKEYRDSVRKRFNSGNNLNQSQISSSSQENKPNKTNQNIFQSTFQPTVKDRSKSYQNNQNLLLNFYDQWRMNLHGQILLKKEKQSSFNLLTSVYPYSQECLKLQIGKTYIFYESEEFKLNMQNILFKRSPRQPYETHIIKIPSTQITLQLKWKCKGVSTDHYFVLKNNTQSFNRSIEDFQSQNLVLYLNVNFPKLKDQNNINNKEFLQQQKKKLEQRQDYPFRKIVKQSEVIFFHYQQELVDWIQRLPQLRKDIINLYSIQQPISPYQKFQIWQQQEFKNQCKNLLSDSQKELLERQQSQEDEEEEDIEEDQSVYSDNILQSESESSSSDLEEEETDSEEHKKKQQKYTDYITLFKDTINQQLNSKDKRGTFMRHIESIAINAQMQTIRLSVSNRQMEMPTLAQSDHKEEGNKKTIGMQFVFDSLNFSSAFYLRKVRITGKQLQLAQNNIESLQNQLEWGMKSGKGNMEFVYGGVFKLNGSLLSLDLPIFKEQQEEKEKTASKSFMKFFHLKSEILGDRRILFDLDQVLDQYQPKKQLLLKKESCFSEFQQDEKNSTFLNNNNPQKSKSMGLDQQKIEENIQKKKFNYFRSKQSKKLNDELDFDMKGVFFKTDEMQYFQNTEQDFPKLSLFLEDLNQKSNTEEKNPEGNKNTFFQYTSSQHDDMKETSENNLKTQQEKQEKVLIKHYIQFGGCKLLVTSYLVKLIQNIFWGPSSQQEKKKKNNTIDKKMEDIQKNKDQIKKTSSHSQQQHQQQQKLKKSSSKKIHEKKDNNNNKNNKEQQQDNEQQNFRSLYGGLKLKKLFTKKKIEQNKQNQMKTMGLAINVKKPQFNLQYIEKHKQLIIACESECYMMWRTNYLPFDKYRLDAQKQMILFFNSFNCYTIPAHLDLKEKVYWYEPSTNQPLYNQPVRIISAKEASLTITSYELESCEIDFFSNYEEGVQTKTYEVQDIFSGENKKQQDQEKQEQKKEGKNREQFWGNFKRAKNMQLSVESLSSQMNSYDFKTFQLTLEFVGVLVSSEEKEKNFIRQMQKQQRELQLQGDKRICQHILNKFPDYKLMKQQLFYLVQYKLKTGFLEMLDEKNKVFLELSLENLSSESNYFKNNMIKFGINIDSINIDNMQEKNEDFRHILNYSKQNNNNKPIINIQKHFYNIPGVTQETQWTIYDVYEVFIPPLTIRLTEDIYQPFYDYFFKKDSNTHLQDDEDLSTTTNVSENSAQKTEEEEASQIDFPFYYGNVIVKDLKFCIYFQSESSLKRLNGVSVIIDPYSINKQFWTTQALFDDFSYYIKMQVASQAFSLIGQKLFGYSKSIQSKEDKDKKKKKK